MEDLDKGEVIFAMGKERNGGNNDAQKLKGGRGEWMGPR